MIGKTVSHYEIVAKIGEGGMGVVYRARDTRLGRQVAVKFLGDEVSATQEFIARFRREAQVLALLNHPGIASLYDVGTCEGCPFLVLEFVEGETLAAKLERGALPPQQAVALMLEVARSLARAHAHGVIHRDLKPGNLMLTPDGSVKILDFGLARRLPTLSSDRETGREETTICDLTAPGRLMGTTPYMSPEQARSEPVDARTDIWSFGCIFYECLTGRRAFRGRTDTECIAAVLMGEPDWQALPQDLQPEIRRILERCLRKDRERRYHAVADVAIELADILAEPTSALPAPSVSAPARRRWSRRGSLAMAMLALGMVAGVLLWQGLGVRRSSPREPFEFALPLPPGVTLNHSHGNPLALAPDGRRLAFAGIQGGDYHLYFTEIGQSEAIVLPGTQGAVAPFFSPCGEWIAFFAEQELRKISVARHGLFSICHTQRVQEPSGTWGEDGTILFRAGSALQVVSADGGEPTTLPVHTDLGRCLSPSFLPGSKSAVVLVTRGQSFDNYWIAILDLASGQVAPLLEVTTGRWEVEYSSPQYLDTGHIIYMDEAVIRAVPFDPVRQEVRGNPLMVSQRLSHSLPTYFAVSRAGTAVYLQERVDADAAAASGLRNLVWADRQGVFETIPVELRGKPMYPAVAPDGRHVCLTVRGQSHRRCWTIDLARSVVSTLTYGNNDHASIWRQDGQAIVFSSDRDGPSNIYWKPVAGQDDPIRLTFSDNHQCPSSWTPDGREVVFVDFDPTSGGDIWIVDVTEPGRPRPLVVTEHTESHGMVSPDGRWLAYTSTRTGVREVYLDRFPEVGQPVRVSRAGGQSPLWAPDGTELYYLRERPGSGDDQYASSAVMAVTIETTPALTVGPPQELFSGSFYYPWSARPGWDVAPDGSRFLLIAAGDHGENTCDLRVVLNWDVRLTR